MQDTGNAQVLSSHGPQLAVHPRTSYRLKFRVVPPKGDNRDPYEIHGVRALAEWAEEELPPNMQMEYEPGKEKGIDDLMRIKVYASDGELAVCQVLRRSPSRFTSITPPFLGCGLTRFFSRARFAAQFLAATAAMREAKGW